MNRATGGNCINLDITISSHSVAAFVFRLNEKFPDLNAEDLTNTCAESHINGHQARFIRMRCDAIQKHLLPLIAQQLKANLEKALNYQKKYSYNEVACQLHQIFAKKGILLTKTDPVEETVCYMAYRYQKSPVQSTEIFR